MTREEAIEYFKMKVSAREAIGNDIGTDYEAYKIAISALRPASREQVEKVWRGEWEFDAAATEGEFGGIRCSKCHTAVSFGGKHAFHNAKTFEHFCPSCGAPMTDEAVEIRLKELEALKDGDLE